MRKLILFAVLAYIPVALIKPMTASSNAAAPILIEFFTSDGCPNCPPVDTWLEGLTKSQPIPNTQVILLSEHIDYFDRDGWKDPYSSSILTDRQREYARVLGLKSPYTPQVIVNGKSVLPLNDGKKVNQLLLNSTTANKVPLQISRVTADGDSPTVIRAHISADGTLENSDADVYVAVALEHAESQVIRDENSGGRLMHASVVEELAKIGRLKKGKPFSQDFEANVKRSVDPGNLQIIVFVQERDLGAVVGAALRNVDVLQLPQKNQSSVKSDPSLRTARGICSTAMLPKPRTSP